ncbi:MAG: phage holin [Bacilli bacterium]|nr:phage holin [Bacilli bacterium]
MSNKLYDVLNKIQRWLPSLGIFYLAMCQIWELPYGNEINETIVAVATLLATTLEIATSNYLKKGADKDE